MDCEDSVASVDIEDKLKVYRNWLGLMKGTLACTIEKDNKTTERTMEPDREYIGNDGNPVTWSQPDAGQDCRQPSLYRHGPA